MTEQSSDNRHQLESAKVKVQDTVDDDDDMVKIQKDIGFHGDDSSLRALIRLFLKHYQKAEAASILVLT